MRFKVNKEAYGQSYFQKSTEDSHSESKRTLALCSAVPAFSWGRDARKPASPAQTRLNRLLGKPFCKNNVMLPSPKQVHRVIMCQPYCKMWMENRGGSRIFFRRGCTRLLLYFNTNKPLFFSQNTSCIRKPQVISVGGGGVHTPCPLPLDPPLEKTLIFVSTRPDGLGVHRVEFFWLCNES